ncbi:MAG: tetratricopeptide repeat protein [Bryobacteraceae bacterium]
MRLLSDRIFSPFLCALAVLALPAIAPAQKKEILEVQRDVAAVQDQVRTLQRTVDEKLSGLTVLVQQTLDAAHKSNNAQAGLDRSVNDKLAEQAKMIGAPIAGVGSKVDQMASEFQSVKESMSDLLSRMSRLEQKLVDLGNQMRVIREPPPAPTPGSATMTQPGAGGGPPAIPAETLYNNAYKDKMGGKNDLALQQFAEYLKYYGNTDLAPNAEFWIGQIYYDAGNYEEALKHFDMVLEKYSEGAKTPDAMYMKGQSLFRLGQKTAAQEEYRRLYSKYPNTEQAGKACAMLKGLGYNCPPPAQKKTVPRRTK